MFTLFGACYLGGVQVRVAIPESAVSLSDQLTHHPCNPVRQYWIYTAKFQQWFPRAGAFAGASMREKLKDKAGQWALFQQILFDNVLHNPFLYLPVFYVFKASIQKEDAPALAPDAAAAVAGACTEGGEGAARTAAAAAAGGGGGGGDGVLEVTKRGLQKWKDNFWEDNIAMWALCIPSDVIGTSPPAYSELLTRVLAFSRSRVLDAPIAHLCCAPTRARCLLYCRSFRRPNVVAAADSARSVVLLGVLSQFYARGAEGRAGCGGGRERWERWACCDNGIGSSCILYHSALK